MALQFVTDQFKDQAITAAKIANATITATQIAANAITASELADDAVDTNAIADNAVDSDKIAANAVGSSELNLAANYTFSGQLRAAEPSVSNDVATKNYVDNASAGLHWKDSCVAASTANVNITSDLENGDTLDGVTLATGERVLLKNQTTASQNGVYVVPASGAATRSTDMDAGSEFPGAAMFIREGTVNADTGWVCTNDAVTLGSTSVAFSQFTGGATLTGGNGITITGNSIAVDLKDSGSGLDFSGGELQIAATGVSNAMLAGSITNAKLVNASVNFGGVTVALGASDTTPAFDLAHATNYPTSSLVGTITNAQLAGSIADSKLAVISSANKVNVSAIDLDGATDIGGALAGGDLLLVDDGAGGTNRKCAVSRIGDFLAGDGLAVASGVLAVGVDDSSIEINSDAIRVKASGITNNMLAGSIADTKMLQISTADKVAGTAVQLAGTSAIENSTGLRLKSAVAGDGLAFASQVISVNVDDSSIETNSGALRVKAGGITNAMLAGSIANAKLDQITTANQVAGSALQLSTNTALENSGGMKLKVGVAGDGLAIAESAGSQVLSVGVDDSSIEIDSDALRVKALGITNAMLAGSIADSKLSTITTGNKVSGSAVQLSGSSLVNSTGLKINSNAVTLAMCAFRPAIETAAGNGSATTFDLPNAKKVDSNFYDAIMVVRNGQVIDNAAGAGVDKYQVSEVGGTTTRITFGTAPLNGDAIRIHYFY